MADETINRVASKVSEISPDYVGNKFYYSHAVAQNVFKESLRRKEIPTNNFFLPTNEKAETANPKFECLDNCLNELPPEQRDLILHYYEDKQAFETHFLAHPSRQEDSWLTKALREAAKKINSKMKL